MLKKTLRSVAVAGFAIAASVGLVGVASASTAVATAPAAIDNVIDGDVDKMLDLDIPDVNVGNNLCLLPWFWPGPFNVLTQGQTGSYSACNGSSSSESDEGINILNDACVAPWLWQGPFNVLTQDQYADYEACNSSEDVDIFANSVAQYMTIQYMIDEGMLDADLFESFLNGDVSSHDVIIDDSIVSEIDASVDGDVANDACVLPWLWQGPLNFLTQNQTAFYEACND